MKSKLDNIVELCVEDILSMSDEEVMNELQEKQADEIKRLRERLAEAQEVIRAINRRASPDPARTFDDAIRDLEHVTALARAFLAKKVDLDEIFGKGWQTKRK